MPNESNKKEELSPAGRLFILGISGVLAAYLSKKLVEKYPNGEISRFIMKGLIFLFIYFIIVFAIMFILSIGSYVYEFFTS